MARRIIAYLPFLTKEEVQLYQPMLLPMGLAIVGSLLIAIGMRRKAAKVEPPAPVPEPAPLVSQPEIIAPRPRPKLVAARKDQPAAPVAALMTADLEPAKGRQVSLEQCFARYTSDSGKRVPIAPDGVMDAMSEFCKSVGIRTKIEGDKLYLIDVELADTSRAGRRGPMGRLK
jgi:hypothetical protein